MHSISSDSTTSMSHTPSPSPSPHSSHQSSPHSSHQPSLHSSHQPSLDSSHQPSLHLSYQPSLNSSHQPSLHSSHQLSPQQSLQSSLQPSFQSSYQQQPQQLPYESFTTEQEHQHYNIEQSASFLEHIIKKCNPFIELIKNWRNQKDQIQSLTEMAWKMHMLGKGVNSNMKRSQVSQYQRLIDRDWRMMPEQEREQLMHPGSPLLKVPSQEELQAKDLQEQWKARFQEDDRNSDDQK